MKLDNEQQREVILAAISTCSFKGNAVEVVYDLIQAVKAAEVVSLADESQGAAKKDA